MGKLLQKIYDHSPTVVQNIGVSLYGVCIYRREYGDAFEKKLAEFEQNQWLSPSQLTDYQHQRLQALIAHCYEYVPYYRRIMDERRLKPDDIQTVGDLRKLPILTREDVRRNFAELTATNARRSHLQLGHTSGTTGSPLEFYYDDHACLIKNVVDWRQKGLAGIHPGDKLAFFLGRVVVPTSRKKPPFWRVNWVLNHLFFSSFHLSEENIDTYVEELERFAPSALEGYPSTAYIIARFLTSRGKTIPLKAVFTSSETLLPQQRETIEKAFECKLFDFYGLAERVVFATECSKHDGHHLNTDFGITEVLDKDGAPVACGQMGRIVATGLHNFAMPLIRYQTSDITSMRHEPCSCGRSFPLMEDVATKAEDIITTRDGRYISSSILTHPFKPMHGIVESQIIQEDREHIRIRIVKRTSYRDKDSTYLVEEMKKRVGRDMKIDIEFVDCIERTKAGKFRWVISRVPLEF